MATLIKVTPELLNTHAGALDSLIGLYKGSYERIYSEKNVLQSGWQGEANQAYSRQLDGFHNDFVALETLLRQFESFIKTAASQYTTTEQDLANTASTTLNISNF